MTDRCLEGPTDGQLLVRFATRRDEVAFRELVGRHGPMVLGVCRQVLGHPDDAEDAFQAVFIILARRAGSIRQPHLLGNWLYGVAYRTALKARARDARRREQEKEVAHMSSAEPARVADWQDCGPVLHEELRRLPEAYRVPIVLCFLEGRTNEDAARRLGWPAGTLKSRLHRGRELLRSRLVRRGLTLSAALLALLLGRSAEADVQPGLAEATVQIALDDVMGPKVAGRPARAVALADEVLHEVALRRARVPSLSALAFLGLVAAASFLLFRFARPAGRIDGDDDRGIGASTPAPPPVGLESTIRKGLRSVQPTPICE